MLQEFLNNNLLHVAIDADFEKLKKSSDELVKILNKNKLKVQNYTLVVIDPEINIDNPEIMEVQEVITKKWNTFLANSGDTPITIIRAVMLEALKTVSQDSNLASLIWLTAHNVQRYFKLIGKEKDIITNFLVSIGDEIEKKASEDWSLPLNNHPFNIQRPNAKNLGDTIIDKLSLEQHLLAASASVAYKGENPYSTQNYDEWHNFFSKRAAQGIADEVTKGFKIQSKELYVNQSQFWEEIKNLIDNVSSNILEKSSLMQLRTQLLWWKESGYSSTQKQSYRELSSGVLELTLANDYSSFIPFIYPNSVNYFLKEVHKLFLKVDDKQIQMKDLLKFVESSRIELKNIFIETSTELKGRITLLNFIGALVWNKCKIDEFKSLVGFEDSEEITLCDFTLWIFHDLQSLKIITSK